jgi:hypothetical protein
VFVIHASGPALRGFNVRIAGPTNLTPSESWVSRGMNLPNGKGNTYGGGGRTGLDEDMGSFPLILRVRLPWFLICWTREGAQEIRNAAADLFPAARTSIAVSMRFQPIKENLRLGATVMTPAKRCPSARKFIVRFVLWEPGNPRGLLDRWGASSSRGSR